MKLTYSEYKTYLSCPRLYYNQKHKIKPPEKPSEYFSLYGRLIEMFFERYTNEIVKNGQELNENQIRGILKHQWSLILDRAYVIWDEPWVKETSEQIYESVCSDVVKNLAEFDFWKHAKSEVPIKILLKKTGDVLSGRLDFLCTYSDDTVEILDGKGTHKLKNVDEEQLYFYALMYYLKYRRFPDKLGFLFYRYQQIKYIDFDKDRILGFKNKLALTKRLIKKDKEFKASVGISKQCKWCAYSFSCDAFIKRKNELAEKRASKNQVGLPEYDGGVLSFSSKGEEK